MKAPVPRKVMRWLRYFCYAAVLVLLWNLSSEFAFVTLQKGDNSVVGASGTHTVVVRKYDADGPGPARGDAVVFLMEGPEGAAVNRISRVAAVPGDMVWNGEEWLEINGKATIYQAAQGQRLNGKVPDGFYLLLNDNPLSSFPDGRRTSYIPGNVIVGRFLVEMPL